MLCADWSPGRRPKTLSESFAAERSLPNEANGCSRSAATKYSLAALSCSSLPVTIGRPGRVTLTVARWAHPQEPKKIRAKAKPVRICSVPLDAECRDFMESDACLRRPYGAISFSSFSRSTFQKTKSNSSRQIPAKCQLYLWSRQKQRRCNTIPWRRVRSPGPIEFVSAAVICITSFSSFRRPTFQKSEVFWWADDDQAPGDEGQLPMGYCTDL